MNCEVCILSVILLTFSCSNMSEHNLTKAEKGSTGNRLEMDALLREMKKMLSAEME